MKKILLIILFVFSCVLLKAQSVFMLTYSAAPSPNVTTSVPSLANFTNIVGTASTSLNFTTSGTNLVAGGTVTFPTWAEGSFDNSTFTSPLSIGQTGSGFTSQPVTIYVRAKSTNSVGSYSGNVNVASTTSNVNVAISATVSASGGGTSDTVNVNLWDGNIGQITGNSAWNNWTPASLGFNGTTTISTTTSPTFNYATGVSSPITATFSIGPQSDVQSFYTDNGTPYAAASTSGYPNVVFRVPYLFNTGNETAGTDTLIFNNLPTAANNYTIEVISSRASSSGRTETFTIGSTVVPTSGSFTADNNLNNLVGGFVPIRFTSVVATSGTIKLIIKYTNSFSFINAFRIVKNN